jgi:hypothetical protein
MRSRRQIFKIKSEKLSKTKNIIIKSKTGGEQKTEESRKLSHAPALFALVLFQRGSPVLPKLASILVLLFMPPV